MQVFKYLKVWLLLMLTSYLFASNVYAQSILYSSDQWPKRWERAMQHQPMNVYENNSYVRGRSYQKINYRTNPPIQSWGRKVDNNAYARSRVPEYNYRGLYRHNAYFSLAQQRYPALPAPVLLGHGLNGNVSYGGFNNLGLIYPGIGFAGLVSPNIFPQRIAYPNMVYPSMAHPNMAHPW